ncbi:unnamed protein product [Microthlaspi erraticum]|uniref:Phragmoplastin interacting protein 1 n=1 Tax=Microthlaspi erraticum TaxID=1685480 RepID=A0A6D2KU10_9BRAS|nr:unnamed protein product [Microthlaspi erraticum]
MVLSNKKLKQKIREDVVKSLSVALSETNPDPVPNSQPHSLKELLDSASHKPRLSKREKRRNSEDEPNDGIREKKEVENVGTSEKTNQKKRKRDDAAVEGELGDGDEGTKEGETPQQKKPQKKKKKKQKKKRKANKTPNKAEEANVEEKVKVEEVQADTEPKEEDGVVPRKLYVGGIPYQSTEDEIRSYFRSCGVITKVDCKMRPEDGEFSGIAFITFETEDGAKRALVLDRAAMGDRYLTIQQYVKTTPSIPRRRESSGFVPEMVDGYNRVYVGNLAWDTTELDIRKLFSACVIKSVRLGKNKETGEFKGYAHVDFKDSVYVAMALKLDQQVVCGRPVKICCALKERPAGDHSTIPTPEETNNVDSYNMEETYAAAGPVPSEANDGNYFTATVGSGKIKRRVCFECGEKGHLSTSCPKKLQNAPEQAYTKLDQETRSYDPTPALAVPSEVYNGSYFTSTISSSKDKRRICFECGEKGHLSIACPKKLGNAHDQANTRLHQETFKERPAVGSYDLPTSGGGAAATNEANSGSLPSAASVSKVKSRSCYECGEKGHLSTVCPKKLQNANHANSKLDHQTVEAGPVQATSYASVNNGASYMDETYAATDPISSVAATNGANDGRLASAVSIGKIKRRICHECGVKGHLSSACPKKQQK